MKLEEVKMVSWSLARMKLLPSEVPKYIGTSPVTSNLNRNQLGHGGSDQAHLINLV